MPYNPETGIYATQDKVTVPLGMTIPDFMFGHEDACGSAPRRPRRENSTWLIDSKTGRTLTFEDCKRRTGSIARAFYSIGLEEDHTLLIFSPNEVDYPTSVWAAHRLSAVVSCANPAYQPDELKYQIDIVHKHNPVKVVLVHPDSLLRGIDAVNKSSVPTASIVLICKPDESTDPKAADIANNYRTLDDLIAELQSLDLPPSKRLSEEESRTKTAFYIFSSGTTGLPKAVRIPHRALIANVLQAHAHWAKTMPFEPYDSKTKKGDVVLGALPFYHIYGLVVVIHLSLYSATPVVVMNKFSLPSLLHNIQTYRLTTLYVVPPMAIMLIKNDTSKYDLSSVTRLMAGAAPLTAETATAIERKFPSWTFGQGYGQTETCTIVTLFDASVPGGFPGGSAGKLVPSIEAKIVSPEGKPLPPGSVGELWSRSPSNALEYLDNVKSTKETFDDEGFVHTGDECKIDENDWLFIVDRIKELIKVKGFQVAPAELEGHLLDHPDVQDVCVIGIQDERAGERPKAYVQLSAAALDKVKSGGDDASKQIADSIKQHVAKHKVEYKRLAEVEFIESIPKTPSGKLLRRDLRARHAAKTKSKTRL
ncbi:hypothetical protein OIV83_001759 [Microbotryomycetes sp. JL201]|nr:hypothetical protein OIV83_001759 [Microbotryomycetes sp. JL201]